MWMQRIKWLALALCSSSRTGLIPIRVNCLCCSDCLATQWRKQKNRSSSTSDNQEASSFTAFGLKGEKNRAELSFFVLRLFVHTLRRLKKELFFSFVWFSNNWIESQFVVKPPPKVDASLKNCRRLIHNGNVSISDIEKIICVESKTKKKKIF